MGANTTDTWSLTTNEEAKVATLECTVPHGEEEATAEITMQNSGDVVTFEAGVTFTNNGSVEVSLDSQDKVLKGLPLAGIVEAIHQKLASLVSALRTMSPEEGEPTISPAIDFPEVPEEVVNNLIAFFGQTANQTVDAI
ncbi:MAG: hypothetical protein WC897_00025 [Candidatus Gracilibacteria bacterium]